MTTFPKDVKIGPLVFPVVEYDVLMDGDAILHGQMNWVEWRIELSNHNPPIYKFVTLWHEVLHGLNDIYGIGLREKQIAALAAGVTQILQDNEGLRLPPDNDIERKQNETK